MLVHQSAKALTQPKPIHTSECLLLFTFYLFTNLYPTHFCFIRNSVFLQFWFWTFSWFSSCSPFIQIFPDNLSGNFALSPALPPIHFYLFHIFSPKLLALYFHDFGIYFWHWFFMILALRTRGYLLGPWQLWNFIFLQHSNNSNCSGLQGASHQDWSAGCHQR